MKFESLKFRNIRAYGNNLQELKFPEDGSLNIIVGGNGFGKCVSPTTEIEVEILDSRIREEFEKYIKENRI
jgi:hypothetical protein